MNASRGNRPRWTWAPLLIALFLAVGHVCVLPGQSHAATAQHDHDADGDASVHGASCEAMAAPPSGPGCAPSLIASGIADADAAPFAVFEIRATPPAKPSTRPPLFLLHASLLI